MTTFTYECTNKDGFNNLSINIDGKEYRISIPCNFTNNEIICNFLKNSLENHDREFELKLKLAPFGVFV